VSFFPVSPALYVNFALNGWRLHSVLPMLGWGIAVVSSGAQSMPRLIFWLFDRFRDEQFVGPRAFPKVFGKALRLQVVAIRVASRKFSENYSDCFETKCLPEFVREGTRVVCRQGGFPN
jgi:hypothetical protein